MMGVDRFDVGADVNKADEATSTHTGLERGEHPGEAPRSGGKGGCGIGIAMSASLIGRLGSSAFRLSTSTVSMSLAGSRFSSESAPGPFHHGIRGRGGTIFTAALPSYRQQVQADMRTRLNHRPARDIIPPCDGARVSSYPVLILRGFHAAAMACSRVHRNSVPSTQMRCMITANRRARATIAFLIPRCYPDLSADRQSQGRSASPWAYQDRKHGQIPGHRSR